MFELYPSDWLINDAPTAPAGWACGCVQIVFAIYLCALPLAGLAETSAGVNRAGANIDFRVTIPVVISATGVRPAANIQIQENDISQGFVDVKADSALLSTNSKNGFQLTARHDARLLTGVDVELSGQHLEVRAGIGSMHVIAERGNNQPIPIRYRLHLASGVAPGKYQWPVALHFSNLMP